MNIRVANEDQRTISIGHQLAVGTYPTNNFNKLGVDTRAHAVERALCLGIAR